MKKPINSINQADLDFFKSARGGLSGTNLLDVYQRIATKSAIYPGKGTPLGLDYCALKLNGEAGELAEHVGKAMRDDGLIELGELPPEPGGFANWKTIATFRNPTPERTASIIKEVGDVLWYLSAICNELGIPLSAAAQENIAKLLDRTQRNALRGSGDDR
jgi:NTP pyrophosphatase (non-canonical NTP hydrolase)